MIPEVGGPSPRPSPRWTPSRILGRGAAEGGDKGILDQLGRGQAHPDLDQALALQRALGHPVTLQGLTRVYEETLPGSRVFLTRVEAQGQSLRYEVSWRDNLGHELAHASTCLARHSDGSLELHRSNVYVDPEQRGQALNVKVVNREIELLRGLSSHPDTRITLEAGSMSVDGQPEKLGVYTWARFGFDFAQHYAAGPSKLVSYDRPDLQVAPEQAMGEAFCSWMRRHHPERQDLLERARDFRHPWQWAELPDGIGKAFLTSEQAPTWSGVLRVNDPEFAGLPVLQRSAHSQLQRAEEKQLLDQQQLLEQLHSDDPRPALEQLRHRGDIGWCAALRILAARRADLASTIEEVIGALHGRQFEAEIKKEIRSAPDPDKAGWSRQVLSEHRQRLKCGWPGYGPGGRSEPLPSWSERLEGWFSRWFKT